jgi:glycosyltransferase involved in cell wall biosynthesis
MNPWLLVAGDLTPLGGMDAANYALARHLAGRGHELHIVAHRVWSDVTTLPGVTVHHVWRPFDRHLLGSPFLARTGRRVWRVLQGRGARAVANGGNCPLSGANWVHYLHAACAPSTAGPAARRAKQTMTHARDLAAERRALRAARLVICNSERTRRDVIDRHGIAADRISVVYYGSDPTRLVTADNDARAGARRRMGWPSDRPLAGFVGALGDRRKGFDTLFDAWSALCRDPGWDADLVVVGSGAELPAWRRRAASAGIAPRLHFLGFRDDVPDILAALDGLVHPARYEAYGLAVHEAMCRGVPAIVSADAGVAERFPSHLRDLLLTDSEDAGELIERLRHWRSHLTGLRELVAPVAVSFRAWTWGHMAADIAAAVERAA